MNPFDPVAAAEHTADLVFRTDLEMPGYVLFDLGPNLDSHGFRELLVRFCLLLGEAYQRRFGRKLRFLSLGHFDQQNTTKPHRDGAPDESILVLGYEPSDVQSA